MGILQKVLCSTGRHSGHWSLPDARCETIRTCDACGKTEALVLHTWGEYVYTDAGRCGQVRRCGRCRTAESRTRHEWGPWQYLNTEFSSPQFHSCRRCHETEKTSPTMR